MSDKPWEILLGPPGTGKTHALLNIVDDELTSGTPPDRIGYVSFTRKAADEAITRAMEKFSFERSALPWFRTLHSLCFRYLGLRSGDVLENRRMQDFAAWCGIEITGKFSEDGTLTGFTPGDRALFAENLARIRRVTLREQFDLDDDNLSWSEVDRVSRSLREYKAAHGLMDYTDMLSEFVRGGARPKLDVLIGDEVQDMSPLQWLVFEFLARGARRVVVAGDDDQAIYRWAGADAAHLVRMEGDARVLGQSFRVPRAVQRLSNKIISDVHERREKLWSPRDEEGSIEHVGSMEDVDADGDSVLILARNTYVLREQVEPELRRRGIVYERHGHSSVKLDVLSAVVTWENLRTGGAASADEIRRVYEQMSVGVGFVRGHKKLPKFPEEAQDIIIADLKQRGGLLREDPWFDALDRLSPEEVTYMRAARARGESLRKPRVRVSTIHGAKGGEAKHVVVMTEMAWRTFNEMRQGNYEDEARVWYVATTRASEKLTIVKSRTKQECPWL